MSSCYLYARVSTEGQDLDNQRVRLREYARLRGWKVLGEYTDIASGANPNRPGLVQMLDDARRQSPDFIVIVKLDRIMRSVRNLLDVVQTIESYGSSLYVLDQSIDTSSPSGQLMLTLLGAIAEYERELIRDRTLDGMARAAAEGRTAGRPAIQLSEYQLEKARQILAEDPTISHSELARQFTGISKQTLIKLLRKEGLI